MRPEIRIAAERSDAARVDDEKTQHCQDMRIWVHKRSRPAAKAGVEHVRKKRKVHRSSAREFLISLHNMLLQMLGVGLMYFVVSAAMGARNPLSWPSLGVSLDEGSDGLCAINFAERKLGANVNPHWDDAHGIKNDLNLMPQSVGLWTHTLLMLAARRAFHGPWA